PLVEEAGQQVADVVLLARVGVEEVRDVGGGASGRGVGLDGPVVRGQVGDQPAQPLQARLLVLLAVVDGARDGGVHGGAACVLVGEDLVLQGQKDAGGIDEVDQRQAVLLSDALRPQDLLGGGGEEGAGLDGGVVGDDHDAPAGDGADAGDDAGGGGAAPVAVH